MTADALREDFGGSVLTPEDSDFDDARSIFNSAIERRPSVIAQCESADDIAAAIAFARENDLEVAVRGGGHSVSGACLTDGGLVVDVRRMNTVDVDPDARTATAAGGATWSDFDRATQPHSLATTGGRVSTTGVAGLTLGGGSGWLERKHGLACDNLVSVELVTADGSTVTASEDENPELFWALHGAGGNFGVATSLTFQLHELPHFSVALLLWPAEAGREVAGIYRQFAESAPDEIGGGLIYITGPPEEFVPEELQGKLVCGVLVTHTGPESELRELAKPVLDLSPEGEMIAEMPYAELQCMLDDPPGYRNYWSAEYLAELPDEALDLFCARAKDMVVPSPSQHIVFPQGGAVARNSVGPMAIREAPWAVHPLGLWEDPADDDRAIMWARDTRADVKPWAIEAVYLNFTGDEGEERIISAYGKENYERLAAVKAEFDPDSVFHLHHPIRPLAAA
ncbi:MAG: FAD-binding oxidoreductase [Actinomycetota bacterium]